MSNIRTVRGMSDLLPADLRRWQFVEQTVRALLASYGYGEIRTPILERTELFTRGIGEVTDIVEKEMYTFDDRNGESLSLRPECTASVVRAAIQAGMLRNQVQKLWYIGPMFRYEKPQKGRYRQFHQIGAEAFGLPGPKVDAELILMLARIWRDLGLGSVELQLNSLGTAPARQQHREALQSYLREHFDILDEDARRRLDSNPLRILDTKNPKMQDIVEGAPRLAAYLDDECRAHFAELQQILRDAGQPFSINPRLVRGLDYYSRTVFEWVTTELGAQGTVCGGGRYDGLVEQIGGSPCPGVGFSIGMERLVELLEIQQAPLPEQAPLATLIAMGDEACAQAHPIAERIRDELGPLGLLVDAESGSGKAKFRRADRSGARVALIIGEQELACGEVAIKFLREQREQETCAMADVPRRLLELAQGV
jgi:histidyl-tRNA synthetase